MIKTITIILLGVIIFLVGSCVIDAINKETSLENYHLKEDIKAYEMVLEASTKALQACREEKQEIIDYVFPPAK